MKVDPHSNIPCTKGLDQAYRLFCLQLVKVFFIACMDTFGFFMLQYSKRAL